MNIMTLATDFVLADLISKVTQRLKELNVPFEDVSLSEKKDKKIKVRINQKEIHFGAKNSMTFLEGASEAKRKAYQARHAKIYLKNGQRAIDSKYSPAWLSYYVLW